MDTSELKLKILREIDSLDKSKLQELYGYVQNYVRGTKNISDWDTLSEAQQDGIRQAIDDLDKGVSVVHEDVISKYRKKYSDG
jgi:hypothetical protein